MAERHQVSGFDEYIAKVESIAASCKDKRMVAMFSGGKNDTTGKSWCPDCVDAQPVVDGVVDSSIAKEYAFIYCSVGGRDFWKDPNCEFRKDKRTLLKSIPTLLKIDANLPRTKLVERQCCDKSLVAMMFEEED